MNSSFCSTNENARPMLLRFRGLYHSVFVAKDMDMPESILAVYTVSKLPLDPVWLLVVAPPSSGKTASLDLIKGLPGVFQVSTLSEGALLSGSPNREHTATSTGGILRQIGDRGLIVCKDFTSILSMNKDKQASTYAALREVYDGSWTRCFGTDGGKTETWNGHVCLVGAVTEQIDRHHSAISIMGERFMLIRPRSDEEFSTRIARRALENQSGNAQNQKDLKTVTHSLIELAGSYEVSKPYSPVVMEMLVSLASVVCLARTAIGRDGYSREIELVSSPEEPGRLVKQFGALFQGFLAIGNTPEEAMMKVKRIGLDSIPELRRRAILSLYVAEDELRTSEVAQRCGYPTSTVQRSLEDLLYLKIVNRDSTSPETWSLGDKLSDGLLAISQDSLEDDAPFDVLGFIDPSPEIPQIPSISIPAHIGQENRVSSPQAGNTSISGYAP